MARRAKWKRALAIVAAPAVALAALRVAIPPTSHVARSPELLTPDDPELLAAPCTAPHTLGDVPVLPDPFSVLVWNIYKGDAEGWRPELERWSASRDLLLLQESASPPILGHLPRAHAPLMARAFTWRGRHAGVLTASASTASACVLLADEPWLGIPKSTLITRHPLGDEQLLVANVHGVNFTAGVRPYRAQLDAIADQLAAHTGPILLAGDLNTWSARRTAELDRLATRLDLTPVPLSPDHRVRKAGHPLDHAWIRGLEVVEASAPTTTGSDHNPLLLTLRLP